MSSKSKMTKKTAPPVLSQNSSNIQNTKSGLDPEAEDRFEVELCWCIEQIQLSFNEKINPKQAESARKSLNILKSHNSSLIKKRQVMRNIFGDYRQKMADDEKKFSNLSTSFKFTPVKKSKSMFLKKANKDSLHRIKQDLKDSVEEEKGIEHKRIPNLTCHNEPFKFNFIQSDT